MVVLSLRLPSPQAMFAFLLLFLLPVLARPVAPNNPLRGGPSVPPSNKGTCISVCNRMQSDPCSSATNVVTVDTPLGQAQGVSDGNAVRFVVTYATASRWQQSAVATQWQLP